MTNIKLLNKIAKCGTDIFDKSKYTVAEEVNDAAAIMVRSASMHEMEFDKSLLAIARAGAGVNNIPLDKCAEEGIVVFNTPGANANAVKELAILALLMSCRKVTDAIDWAKTLTDNEDIAKAVEKGKSAFVGPEIYGKTLGIIGLGAIGAMVANAAISLGMNVIGYDPYLSVKAALSLNPNTKTTTDLNEVFANADFISLHVPSTPSTKGMINSDAILKMKDGVRIINLARADLVDSESMKSALDNGKVATYVTDFPNNSLCVYKNVIAIPHLGASTPESEDNCAIMAAKELVEFIENGNVINSVNYPNVSVPMSANPRITVLYKANDDAIANISSIASPVSIASAVRGNYGYAILDVKDGAVANKIDNLEFVIRTRVING
ncbi:MAG: 3-phosphoglycerate dehydrogenase [Ruminococcaceae bacterium]|nr:3-phosphoglycerate dehydrogenase [Oscillospiraceae bacterium]